jgi:hypothetical protein
MKHFKKKSCLLGENYSTACYKLRKIIMFNLARRTGEDSCYRCGKIIRTIEEFSIDHIEQWIKAEDPHESFYDLNNIAFSHLSCNIKHGGENIENRVNNLPKIPHNRKLDEGQILDIRLLGALRVPQRAIADRFNIHHQTVWQILNRKTYRDVE